MHFDQFNAVKNEKLCFFTTHPISALPHHAHFQMKNIGKSIAFFFQIYWSIIVDQIHTYQILQTDLMWLRMLSWFSKNCRLLVLGGSFNVL